MVKHQTKNFRVTEKSYARFFEAYENWPLNFEKFVLKILFKRTQ